MQIVVDLKDKASKQLTGINKKFGGMVAAINPVAIAVTAVAASFAALGGVAVASVNAFRDFEEGMAGVAKTTGMSGEALAELGNGIKEMAKTIPVAHTELADIAAVAGQLGIQGKNDILAFTKTASEVAVAFDIPAEKAATVMAKLTNIYGLGIEEASNLASAINVLGNTTAASESQISDYAMSLGAAADQMGFSSTEAVAMGATLISMGMDASDAGTRLNSAFTVMSKKTEEVAGFLGMTEQAFRDAFAKDQMGMIMQIVAKLSEIEDPLERAKVASELFGTVGAKAINGLGVNLEGLQTNLDNAASGFEENTSLAEEFAAKTNTLNASFQLLKNSLTGVAIGIGEKLAPYVRILVEKFIELIPKIEAFANGIAKDVLPGVISFAKVLKDDLHPGFDSLKSAAESMLVVLTGLYEDFTNNETAMSTMTSVVNVLVDAFNFLAGALAAAWKFFADHPTITKAALAIAAAIALIISPILAIIAAVALLAVAWDQNWFGIKDTVLRIVDIIVEKVTWFLDIIEEFWIKHGDTIIAVVTFMWDLIKGYIETAMDFISTGINVALDLIEGDWRGAWERIVEFTGRVSETITGIWDTWGGSIQTLIYGILEYVRTLFETALNTILSIVETVLNAIKSIFESDLNTVQSTVDSILNTIKGIFETVFNAIMYVVESVLNAIRSIVETVLNAIKSVFETVFNAILYMVSYVLSVVKNTFESSFNAILNVVSSAMSSIKSSFESSLNSLSSTTSRVFGSIKSTVSGAMSSVIGSVTSAWSKVKSTIDSIISKIKSVPAIHNKTAPHDRAHNQSHSQAAPHNRAHEKWDRISFDEGGYVGEDVDARIHKGEYVIPKKGALVATNSTPSHVKITYNIGSVTGVNDMEKLLAKHDRELYRKLVALV